MSDIKRIKISLSNVAKKRKEKTMDNPEQNPQPKGEMFFEAKINVRSGLGELHQGSASDNNL